MGKGKSARRRERNALRANEGNLHKAAVRRTQRAALLNACVAVFFFCCTAVALDDSLPA